MTNQPPPSALVPNRRLSDRYQRFWMKRRRPPTVSIGVGRWYAHTGWCPSNSRFAWMRNGESALSIWLPPFTLELGRRQIYTPGMGGE